MNIILIIKVLIFCLFTYGIYRVFRKFWRDADIDHKVSQINEVEDQYNRVVVYKDKLNEVKEKRETIKEFKHAE